MTFPNQHHLASLKRLLLISTLYLSISFSSFNLVKAAQFNVTIDDQDGDPTNDAKIIYTPAGAWNVGQNCSACTAQPKPQSDAYLGTWMDATFNPKGTETNSAPGQIVQASVSFVGTAVYVICILTGSSTSPDANTDMTFILDGTTVKTFSKAPDGDTTYHFNQTVFAQTGLSNSSHSLQIQTGNAGAKALILLDAIIYTKDNGVGGDDTVSSIEAASATASTAPNSSSTATPDSSSSSSSSTSKSNTGAIVGGVVGALAFIGLLGVLFFWFRRRRLDQYPHTGSTFSRTRKGYNNPPDSGEAPQRQMDMNTSMPTRMVSERGSASVIGSSAYFTTTIGSEFDEGMTETGTDGPSTYRQSRWYQSSAAPSGTVSTNGAQVGHGNVGSGSSSGVGSGIGYGVGVGLQGVGKGGTDYAYAGRVQYNKGVDNTRGPLPSLPIGAYSPSLGPGQDTAVATPLRVLPPAYDTLTGSVDAAAAGRLGAEKKGGIKAKLGPTKMRVVNAEVRSTYTSSEGGSVRSAGSRGTQRGIAL